VERRQRNQAELAATAGIWRREATRGFASSGVDVLQTAYMQNCLHAYMQTAYKTCARRRWRGSVRGTWAPDTPHEALAIKGSAALPIGELTGVFVPFGLAQLDVGGNDLFAQAFSEHT
jgi:hypothetical protein